MKKFYLFLLVSFLTLSCSTDDDTSGNTANINPPSWIHGTWNPDEGINASRIEFTVDNVTLLSTPEFSHKNEIKDYRQQGYPVSVTENITPQQYDLKIVYPMGTCMNYTFRNIDENTITWHSGGFPEIELQKQ